MSACELVLSYEHNCWRARGAGIDATHTELTGLEAQIAADLAVENAPLDVHLRFDMAVLPRWLHQYHNHYCNYVLRVPPREICA